MSGARFSWPIRARRQPLVSYHLQPRLQHLSHGIHPCPQRRVDQVGVALRGANLGVAEQPPDHFQRRPAGNQQRGESVAQIVNADVGDVGLHPHPFPKALEINHGLPGTSPGNRKGQPLGKASLRRRIKATASCEIGTRWTRRCLV